VLVATLESLKVAALEQEHSDFDPSGTGGVGSAASAEDSKSHSSPEADSDSYGVATVTTALSELQWDDTTTVGVDLEEMSFQQKEEYLKAMFTTLKPYDVLFVLKKCKGVLCRAIDELLNISSLEEEEARQPHDGHAVIPKGIDGFLSYENDNRGRKGKSKRHPRTNETSRASAAAADLSEDPNGPRNVWTTSKEDVHFISSRTSLPQKLIRSTYHANAASLPATIRAIVAASGASFSTLNELDPFIQTNIVALRQDFQHLSDSQLFGLLHITRNIPSAARELAEAMVSSPEAVQRGKVAGMVQYAPFNPAREIDSHSPRPSSQWTTVDPASTRAVAASHDAAARVAYAKASAAYKRGKSDHLMNGVAAYYADVARERSKAAKASLEAAADAHVASQSSPHVLDLHGVGVAAAVRIVQARVNIWWDSLGDTKYAPRGGGPARDGYRIVTGIGRHSKNGAPRIGPAVSRMLVREGWKIEIGQGEIIVYGKARR
jgi:hypothetical protein